MRKHPSPLFFAVVGDIHGRFDRICRWLEALEAAKQRTLDFVLAVGDVEAFRTGEDFGRKLTKRPAPLEFAPFGRGERRFPWPLYWIGGNNEGFDELDRMRAGGELAPNIHYLGRSGIKTIGGLQVAYLSGIYAPRFFALPPKPPTSPGLAKQAGYFRTEDLEVFERGASPRPHLMLLHEWPRGLVGRRKEGPKLRADRFPWIGNPIAKQWVDRLEPQWLFCGHSHVPLATTLHWSAAGTTRVACLDQATRVEGSLLWMEWEGGEPHRAGWGTSGNPAWQSGAVWDETLTPDDGVADS